MSDTGPDTPEPDPGVPAGSPGHPEPSEQDWSYVMGKLSELTGELTEIAARVSVTEDRTEDMAVALDGIEDAASAGPRLAVVPANTPDHPSDGASPAEPDPDGDPDGGPDGGTSDGIDMAVLLDWVRDHIALLLERKLPQTGNPPHWCRSWWMHAEAIARFEALRRCWADAVTSEEGSAMVVWFEHLDQQLAVLMADGGPFNDCKGGVHRTGSVHALGQQEPGPGYLTAYELLDTGT